MIHQYLEDLERRIDPDVEEALFDGWLGFIEGHCEEQVFSPRRQRAIPPGVEWPHIRVNQALQSFELMALQQLEACSQALAAGSGAVMAVRCNYGTGIMPSLFGAELFLMDDAMDTLPTVIPLGGLAATTLDTARSCASGTRATQAVKALLDLGVPDLRQGLGAKVFDMAAYYQELFAPYPKVQRYVRVYHPDLQGPMDICELLWGSGLFLALLELPDLVTELLELVTETYCAFMDAWIGYVPNEDGYAVHWSMVHRGHIMLRDDSAMNLSPSMFDRFIRPYDQRLLRRYGGGALHFCGRGDHYICRASEMEGLTAVNLSQPECNDMDAIFDHTVERGIAIIGLPRGAAEDALARGRDLYGLVHCW